MSARTAGARAVRAPRGSALSCKGWPQEAAMRMLMNNLDPEVAERPADLVVYGGTGKAARDAPVSDLRRVVLACDVADWSTRTRRDVPHDARLRQVSDD